MSTQNFTDQLKHQVKLRLPVERIVSLVPSQTELLFDLGLGERVVGITKFCVHPQSWRKTKTIIGGTKKFNLDIIDSLLPDLIIGNKEENYQEGIEALNLKYPVWMSDVSSLEDAIDMIRSLGKMTDTLPQASQILLSIQTEFAGFPMATTRKVLYLIWQDPWMTVGKNTFIDSMLEKIGWLNIVQENRYPEVTTKAIQSMNPELILLPSEPFPFNEQHKIELQRLVPTAKVILVDGEMFSWYGSRLMKAPGYFRNLASEIN